MPIPSIPELREPVLRAHRDGTTRRLDDLEQELAPLFELTDEERADRQPSGDVTFVQRIGWARHELVDGGLLERPRHAETRITPAGRELLVSGGPVPPPRTDWAAKPLTRESVLAAIAEFDREGRDATLRRHGFRRALDYVVIHDGKPYDSKALYGIAYGLQYPDEEPIRLRGLQGGGTVVKRLRELGFEVRSQREPPPPDAGDGAARAWLIRAGREGRYEPLALAQNVTLIGWSDLGELSRSASRDELKADIEAVYGEHRPASLASQAGQVYRFLNDVAINDLVVLPLMSDYGHVAVGRVVGEYAYRTDGPFADTDAQNTRPVEWLARRLPYERFDPDLREAFGQQGTVSEISKPHAIKRILEVVGGADASAVHLVLKWSPAHGADTIPRHKEVADARGSVWWGRQSKPGTTGLSQQWLTKLQSQLAVGSETFVFLHSGSASTWRTRLRAVTTDRSDVDETLVPSYYHPDTFHSLWVEVTDFEQVEPFELTDGYVLAQSGDPVTAGGLGNQTPLIIRKQSATLGEAYFALDRPEGSGEGLRYRWTSASSGSWKALARSSGARFVYYRPDSASDGTSRTYMGCGRIGQIEATEHEGVQQFVATIEDYEPFATPVSRLDAPPLNAQTAIQAISRVQYDELVAAGRDERAPTPLNIDLVRESAEERGLNLAPEIYAQLVAALTSGKHVILTGPPGTAKTTLAQAVAEAAQACGLCDGYLLTTATADWTTYETIGGLRPTGPNALEFEEGHFLRAIGKRQWLVIDELNRSHFDRAFGQLFTVLSGQPVVLPYHRPEAGPDKPLVLVPEGASSPTPDGDTLEIPQEWRVIATMNVFDKSLLFEMSFALMRRFAFVEVASPSDAVFEALIERETAGGSRASELARKLLALRQMKDLGPAVFMDLARFLRERIAITDADDGQLLFEAFYSYLLPQFEGVDAATGETLFSALSPLVGPRRRERLRTTLNAVLGLELAPTRSTIYDAEEVEQDAYEQPAS